jgi:hypothetical protein
LKAATITGLALALLAPARRVGVSAIADNVGMKHSDQHDGN